MVVANPKNKPRPRRPRPKKPDLPPPKGVTDTPPGGGGATEGDTAPKHLPPGFRKKLADAGLKVNKKGKIVGIGPGENASKEQLRLMQAGYDKFGLTNQLYDPTRVYATGEMTKTFAGQTPVFYSLSTGRATSGSGLLSDEDLAKYREAAGYDPMAELNVINQSYIDLYGPEQGAALAMTPEEFDTYNRRARINYQHEGDLQAYYQGLHDEGLGSSVSEAALAGMTQSSGGGGNSFIGGFDVGEATGGGGGGRTGGLFDRAGLNQFGMGDVIQHFMQSQENKALLESSGAFFDLPDLATESEA